MDPIIRPILQIMFLFDPREQPDTKMGQDVPLYYMVTQIIS